MAPSKQSSLDSFFGGGATEKKKGPKQKKIESFFGGSRKVDPVSAAEAASPLIDSPPKPASSLHAATAKRKTPDTEGDDYDSDEETNQHQRRTRYIPSAAAVKVSKRRVIDDTSDESDNDNEKAVSEKSKATKNGKVVKDTPDEIEDSTTMEDTETKKDVDDDHVKAKATSDGSKTSGKASAIKADKMLTATKAPLTVKSKISAQKSAQKASSSKIMNTKAKESSSSTSSDQKPDVTNSKEKTLSSRKPSPILKAAAKTGQFKSDEAVLQEIDSDVVWEDDEMPYAVLCQAFGKIEAVTSRLAIQEILTTLFRQILLKETTTGACNTDMSTVLYLASNSVAPAYECVELGIGDAILIKAIQEATGTSQLKEKYKTIGDLGSVAESCKSKQRTLGGFFKSASSSTTKKAGPLTAKTVLATFRKIAQTKGNQSQKYKVDEIKKLLVKSTSIETKYIIRGLQGKLRIGLAQSTVLISLAHALALSIPATVVTDDNNNNNDDSDDYPAEAKQYMDSSQTVEKRLEAAVAIVKKAYSEVPSYEAILDAATKVPLQLLHKSCTLTPGIPVAPMLAKPTKSVQEVLKRLNGLRFTCEYKYDGERAQVHMLHDGTTKVFSRNLLDTSEKYPEVPAYVKESACKDVESFVLDAEVVAYNRETGQLVPFQILSTRKKSEESAETAKVQVIVQAFDLMYLNGTSLLNHTLSERRALLHQHFQVVPGKFQFATSLDLTENGDTLVLEEFLDKAVKGQCEGLMVKTLDVNAIYVPSLRSLNWLKLKKDYLEGLGDSVDLVVLGAYHGRGKRTGVYGAYLLACYDPDTEEFQSVCKIGTGFSDEDLKVLSENLNQHKIPKKSSQYNTTDQLECDVWFDAVQVWEVKAADLSKSSAHRGADGKTGEAGRGIGLRFPRFERVRDDKKPEEATTSDQILDMYYQQDAITGGDNDDDDGGI